MSNNLSQYCTKCNGYRFPDRTIVSGIKMCTCEVPQLLNATVRFSSNIEKATLSQDTMKDIENILNWQNACREEIKTTSKGIDMTSGRYTQELVDKIIFRHRSKAKQAIAQLIEKEVQKAKLEELLELDKVRKWEYKTSGARLQAVSKRITDRISQLSERKVV